MSTIQRHLEIKTGVVKRIYKEGLYYIKEKDQQQAKIDKMVENGEDEYDIKKQREVLDETLRMIPDGKKRLAAAYQELQTLVLQNAEEPSVNATKEFKNASELLKEIEL
ncbi:tubulin-specific chaperone A-like protein [Basidiobolus meristosporus CBS 931.73]|uniref:Tubulin-specific chaperone A n=1 Tax=Basidiobolus meristosporus CBS 931.73 TaxID=1314790 RepID=A0A1Y1WZL7_9FUNG|nr:tubulin-specific chaperone A-like protein [Basidiobolus meristosporus CBS 931.73]|eukprot:ORX78943.1 tubulin-specific chaperone A-like protein [Basidiobolus meristosporus CBS 931.73]